MKKNYCFGKGRMFLLVGVFAFAAICLSSCKSKEEKCIDDLRDIVERVESKGEDMTDEEWTAVLAEYETVTNNAKDCEFTDEQIKEVANLEGQFVAKSSKAYMKQVGGKVKDALKQAGDALGGFVEGLNE